METPLLDDSSQINHYVVHGVTPEGTLVENDRPGLLRACVPFWNPSRAMAAVPRQWSIQKL